MLRRDISCRFIIIIIIILPTSTKPVGSWKLSKKWLQWVINRWQWTCNGQALEQNTVSLLSSVTSVIRLPIPWTSSTAIWFHVPAVSMATGKKRWVPARSQYLEDLLADALSAAAPGNVIIIIFRPSVDIFPREFKNWDIQNWVQIYQIYYYYYLFIYYAIKAAQ